MLFADHVIGLDIRRGLCDGVETPDSHGYFIMTCIVHHQFENAEMMATQRNRESVDHNSVQRIGKVLSSSQSNIFNIKNDLMIYEVDIMKGCLHHYSYLHNNS